MSTATLDPAPVRQFTAAGTGSITTTRLIHSEWLKFRTLRSSWYTLLAGVVGFIAIGDALRRMRFMCLQMGGARPGVRGRHRGAVRGRGRRRLGFAER